MAAEAPVIVSEGEGPAAVQNERRGADRLAIDLVDDASTIRADWEQLESDPLNSLHQGYGWCSIWAQTQDRPLLIIRGRQSGKTVFLLPLEIVLEGGIRKARFPGGRFNNINTGLFDRSFAEAASHKTAAAIAREARKLLRGQADILALQNIPLIWRGRTNPLSHLASVENQNPAFQIPLLANFESTLRQINAKRRRKKFRIQSRRAEEMGGYSHVIARSPQEKCELLQTFFRQKAARFASQGIPDVFRDQSVKDFFYDLANFPEIGTDSLLEIHAIRLHGQNEGFIAAISGLSRKQDHIICQFGSIDETFAEISPGELLFWLMIERACSENAAIFDFGVGDQPYKRSWCPLFTVQHDIFLPVTLKGRAAASAYVAIARTKSLIKSNPALYAFIQRFRAGRPSMDATPAAD
ncbi:MULTISPECIES: polysaccharide biosynthesis GNAT family N-acetyltransferase UppA [Agrobacterium]|uniref:GNAT family N-acetyltransferase n=1 Tax=Agrobacterium tumefaciens TaxID=358 RepID=A0AAJ4T9P6_AGRTU|nr:MULTISPECIES: polysaccharide biosynthesis GNAT family N-acetyltransferase UppA [Agrobacterium]MEA1841004.1 polysaccharide biosynthesis GNAT family N-acetyltransferase UppA [Agrobacterium tumefaciens]MRH97263.1 GNAT family N-acetyltransferase [Agrobacterium tumefaciens]NTA41806.1 GNAT family N-acetyltransferase [Agrobacterium tumefaciens]NTA58147.1 GNAT family N-acetyltransferase [Agrobacterium tumefaciens]QTG13289.1 GNAT family N-acetyltransferase [Agrobacterium tumefaciens]